MWATDDYLYLLPVFAELYNKYIGEDMTVLCYKKPEKELPDNFNIISLGSQADRVSWSDGIIPFFKEFEEPYFKSWGEDYLIYHVETDLYKRSHDIAYNEKKFGRILFWLDENYKWRKQLSKKISSGQRYELDKQFIHLRGRRGRKWRSSLNAGIWDTSYFKSLLRPNLSPWTFEVESLKISMDDDKVQLLPIKNTISYKNNVDRGVLNLDYIKNFYLEDLNEIKEKGVDIGPEFEKAFSDNSQCKFKDKDLKNNNTKKSRVREIKQIRKRKQS
jgi:hypothetical protein